MWLADAVGRAHAVPRAVTNRANDAHWYVVPQVDHSGTIGSAFPRFRRVFPADVETKDRAH